MRGLVEKLGGSRQGRINQQNGSGAPVLSLTSSAKALTTSSPVVEAVKATIFNGFVEV